MRGFYPVFIWPRTWYKFWVLLQPLSPLPAYLPSFTWYISVINKLSLIMAQLLTLAEYAQLQQLINWMQSDQSPLATSQHPVILCPPTPCPLHPTLLSPVPSAPISHLYQSFQINIHCWCRAWWVPIRELDNSQSGTDRVFEPKTRQNAERWPRIGCITTKT